VVDFDNSSQTIAYPDQTYKKRSSLYFPGHWLIRNRFYEIDRRFDFLILTERDF
jgi:hypothetical protein